MGRLRRSEPNGGPRQFRIGALGEADASRQFTIRQRALRVGLTGGVDEYMSAGLPSPNSEDGYTRREVEGLLEVRQVPVPRSTQFRMLCNEIGTRSRSESSRSHRRWNKDEFLRLEAASRLLAAGFARSDLAAAIAGDIDWSVLDNERRERMSHLSRSEDDLALLRSAQGI